MSEPVILEGHLRYAGDGYEWSDFYLDNLALHSVLDRALPHISFDRHHWVVEPPYDEDEEGPEPWTPYDVEARDARYREWVLAGKEIDYESYVGTVALQDDYGLVRITIERLEGPPA